ncbi:hypothetical protein TWF102_001724 [Orbilia oligospora]|uniref:Uncharacterized protein n=1 Tax=Orbilia oligospora TaxID=2813651 RepID=A0A7C8NEP0_ORBOL|nr:hypothetical protein TWF102_001724 [Orbilia oligospora]KAF3082211.1 hypothetical protein TWF103_003390 [Orbilia oligospora]
MVLVIGLVVVLACTPSSAAFEWNNFTNNLATGLAPLITLFGEQVTKQFLSASLSTWDSIIFAMAPLGILTAIVSVIRICGNASLRAFIGRAQESPGTAEVELLSCTSETTSELWHENGIARVFGAPQILQVVKVKSDDRFYEDSDKTAGIFLFGDACYNWAYRDKMLPADRTAEIDPARITRGMPDYLDDSSLQHLNQRPNLSLNIGMKRQPKKSTYAAAAFGVILQGGVLVFAGVITYQFPDQFLNDGKPVEQYVFPLTLFGTILTCFGMFLCGYIIERATNETYYEQSGNKTDRAQMYWVQPGGQKLGDQVFGSFVGFSNDHTYIKSSRSKAAFHSRFDGALWIALITTIFGFVTQFVGLREIHSSVIMAIIRAGLRSQRMTKETDLVKKDSQERYRHILPGHELDFLATKLEDIGTLFVSPKQDLQEGVPPALGISPSQTSSVTSSRTLGNGVRALKARARLARLTSDEEYGVSWKDLRVREVAIQLQSAIEGVMETMSVKLRDPNVRNHQWRLEILSTPEASIETIPETFSLQLRKEGVAWRIDCSELEAILGIWEWSLFRYKAGRAIGGDMRKTQTIRLIAAAPSARLGEAKTWYQVWIQRRLTLEQEGAYSIDRNKPIWTIPIGDLPLFGCQVARDVTDTNQPIYVYTKNSPLTMCAQDVFISFLGGVLREIDEIGGKTETRTPVDSQDVFLLRNNQIDAMVDHFENSGLGSREDAYMCIILMLVRESKLPGSEDVLTAVQDQVAFKKMTANGRTLNNYSDECAITRKRLKWLRHTICLESYTTRQCYIMSGVFKQLGLTGFANC